MSEENSYIITFRDMNTWAGGNVMVEEIHNWCVKHCKSYVIPDNENLFYYFKFKDEADKLLFTMKWK